MRHNTDQAELVFYELDRVLADHDAKVLRDLDAIAETFVDDQLAGLGEDMPVDGNIRTAMKKGYFQRLHILKHLTKGEN